MLRAPCRPGPRAAVVAALTVLAASPAGAQQSQGTTLDLAWSAPAGCPSRDDIMARVAHTRGRPFTASGVALEARATVSRRAVDSWLVRIETPAAGVRTVSASSCDRAADVTALVLALALDAARAPDALPPAPAVTVAPPDAAPAVTVAPPEVAAVHPQGSIPNTPRLALRALAIVDSGALPGELAPGASVAAELALGPLRLAAHATWLPPHDAASTTLPYAGASIGLLAGGARVGAAWRVGLVEPGPFAGIELGALYAAPYGAPGRQSSAGLWLAALGGGALRIEVTPHLAVVLEAAAGLVLVAPEFMLAGTENVLFAPRGVLARGGAGIEVRF